MQICISSFFEYQLNESLQSANSVGLQTQYIFNRRCSIYSTADAVYIQLLMQYIFIFQEYILAVCVHSFVFYFIFALFAMSLVSVLLGFFSTSIFATDNVFSSTLSKFLNFIFLILFIFIHLIFIIRYNFYWNTSNIIYV